MRTKLYFVLGLIILASASAVAQNDFVIARSKTIDTEYTPKPKDFKTKSISWGEPDTECLSEPVTHGTWFRFYPNSRKVKVTLSAGLNWGTISDPLIYIAYLDTVDGMETLVQLGCRKVQGSVGDFNLEVTNLRPRRKHYMLIGADSPKLTFALYLTEKFIPTVQDEETNQAAEDNIQEEAFEKVTTEKQRAAMIIGRVRRIDAKPVSGFEVSLLNDDLELVSSANTDEFGIFKIYDVNPEKINLVRMEGDDSKLLVDMFLYNSEARIIGKPIYLGHRLHSFTARKEFFEQLAILTMKDVVVDVQRGQSSMAGKVVDKETIS